MSTNAWCRVCGFFPYEHGQSCPRCLKEDKRKEFHAWLALLAICALLLFWLFEYLLKLRALWSLGS